MRVEIENGQCVISDEQLNSTKHVELIVTDDEDEKVKAVCIVSMIELLPALHAFEEYFKKLDE